MISPEQKKIQSFFLTFKLFEEELKARREKYARSLWGEKKQPTTFVFFLCYSISRYVAVTEMGPKKHYFLYLMHSFQEL